MGNVFTLYSMEGCSACESVKQLLQSKRLNFKVLMAGEDFGPADLQKITGKVVRSLPQLFHNEEYIGGSFEARRYINQLAPG